MSQTPRQSQSLPRRRWLRRLVIVLAVFVGLPVAFYFYATWSLERERAAAIAETDQLDPRWRLEDIEADRKVVADHENSAFHLIQVRKLIFRTNPSSPGYHKDYEAVFKNLSPAVQLNAEQLDLLQEVMDKLPGAVEEVRKLKDLPHGRFPVVRFADLTGISLDEQQGMRPVTDLLQHDAMVRAHAGDLDGAMQSCLALLHAARSLRDEPYLVSVFLRMTCHMRMVEALERNLGQGYPDDKLLKRMQDELARERDDLRAHMILGIRGDRAFHHEFVAFMHQGKIRLGQHLATNYRARISWREWLADYFPTFYTREYPQHLRHRNQLVAAARLPLHQQHEAFLELDRLNGDGGRGSLVASLGLHPPNLANFCVSHLTRQASLACAETGLASERFRLQHQRWPESLQELVTAGVLEAIPLDPFDGKALRFSRLEHGLAIYSIGLDRQERPMAPGVDVAFRLWDPEQRRQPPRAVVAP